MFSSFISLGYYCGVAASMSRYGFRSASGPFDWFISDFRGIMHCLDNDFCDFLKKGSLVLEDNDNRIFKDKSKGFWFPHDVKTSLEDEYDEIYSKYMRRVDNFRKEIRNGVCFIRAVKDTAEVKYIVNNKEYINSIIKRANPSNEIIFLISRCVTILPDFDFKYYKLNIYFYPRYVEGALRCLFDTNKDFVSYCIANFDESVRKDNLIFDLQTETKRLGQGYSRIELDRIVMCAIEQAYKQIWINETRCQRLLSIAKTDFDRIRLPDRVVIYGAGDIGKLFYDKIKGKCTVRCFIDANSLENTYDGVPIVPLKHFSSEENETVIVIPTYDFDDISEKLKSADGIKSMIVPMERVLEGNLF